MAGRIVRCASFGGRSVFTEANADRQRDGRYQAWGRGWNGVDSAFANDGDILDHQVAICETERGVRLAFHTNTHAGLPQRRWLAIGEDGAAEGDFGRPEIAVRRVFAQAERVALDGGADGHYGADAAMGRDLAACWLDGAGFPVPAKAALEAGLAAMAIDAAQREGRIVDVSPRFLAPQDIPARPNGPQVVLRSSIATSGSVAAGIDLIPGTWGLEHLYRPLAFVNWRPSFGVGVVDYAGGGTKPGSRAQAVAIDLSPLAIDVHVPGSNRSRTSPVTGSCVASTNASIAARSGPNHVPS